MAENDGQNSINNTLVNRASSLFPQLSTLFENAPVITICSSRSSESDLIQLKQLNYDLEQARQVVDSYYKQSAEHATRISQVLALWDPYRILRYQLNQTCHVQNLNSAWLRLYEILCHFRIIPASLSNESFLSLDDGSLPGHWLFALNHYIKTQTSIRSHVWVGLANLDEPDPYQLRQRNPSSFLTKENDSTLRQHIEPVHLFLSDRPCSEQYFGQEEAHALILLSQVELALSILRPNGHIVLRLYSFFLPFTQSLIALLLPLFSELYISKPLSSRVTSCECYLIGMSFREASPPAALLGLLRERRLNWNLNPLNNFEAIIPALVEASEAIFKSQTSSLHKAIDLYRYLTEAPEGFDIALRTVKGLLRAEYNRLVKSWNQMYPIRSLRQRDKIDCIEAD